MDLKIVCLGFWSDNNGFTSLKNNLLDNFDLVNGKTCDVYKKYIKKTIFIICSYINNEEYNFILNNDDNFYVGYITEPVEHVQKLFYDLIEKKKFKKIFGSINQNKICTKSPLYLSYFNFKDKESFNVINKYVKNITIDDLKSKKFCTMIFRHDSGNTRKGIYDLINKIRHVDCPGIFMNNMQNDELNKIGNVNFIKKYMFNICPNNYNCKLEGYIVEKPMLCCLGGAIPIYFGYIDDIDFKIFNKNRFIFYNPSDEKSVINAVNIIENLINDDAKMLDFYKQHVFEETAHDTCMKMYENVSKMLCEISN